MAKTDPWLERAAARDEGDLPELFAILTHESRPATERRLAAITAWPKSSAIAKHSGELLRAFPFDVWALGGATRALGLALVHGAPATAFEHTELARFSADVERWRKPALEAARRFTVRARRAPRAGEEEVYSEALPDTPKALHAAWMKLAAARAPSSLPLLLGAFARGAATDVAARALELLTFERDARVADAIVEIFEYPPVTVRESNPFFVVLGLTLAAHGDRRHAAALKKLGEALPQVEWLDRLLDVRRAVEPPKAATPTIASKPTGPSDERSFVAWIAEAPDDLARRSVYADWLSERGDPRGELMALQLAATGSEPSPAAAKRIAALLKKHQKTWLRPLTRNLFGRSEPVFTDGMLSAIRLDLRKSAPKPDEPLLVGLRRLMVWGRQDAQAKKLLASPLLSGLQELDAAIDLVAALNPAAKARLQTLTVRVDTRDELALLATLELPGLRRLNLDKGTVEGFGLDLRPEEIFALPLAARLEELVVAPSNDSGVWLAAASRAGLRRLGLRSQADSYFDFALGPAPSLRVVLEYELTELIGHRWFVASLATVPPDVRARTVLELRSASLLTAEAARAVEALGVAAKVVPG